MVAVGTAESPVAVAAAPADMATAVVDNPRASADDGSDDDGKIGIIFRNIDIAAGYA